MPSVFCCNVKSLEGDGHETTTSAQERELPAPGYRNRAETALCRARNPSRIAQSQKIAIVFSD